MKSISIPPSLYDKLEDLRIEEKFGTVTDFIVYKLRELVAVYSVEKDGKEIITKDDELRIKERLKELGYL